MSSPFFDSLRTIAAITSCFRDRPTFSRPISLAVSRSSATGLRFKSDRCIAIEDEDRLIRLVIARKFSAMGFENRKRFCLQPSVDPDFSQKPERKASVEISCLGSRRNIPAIFVLRPAQNPSLVPVRCLRCCCRETPAAGICSGPQPSLLRLHRS